MSSELVSRMAELMNDEKKKENVAFSYVILNRKDVELLKQVIEAFRTLPFLNQFVSFQKIVKKDGVSPSVKKEE
jgi:hypothetical protein